MTDPVGSISLAQKHLKETLADCDAFREWIVADPDGDDPAEVVRERALNKIHLEERPMPAKGKQYTAEELQTLYPCAIIDTDPEAGFTWRRSADECYSRSGRLKLMLYQNVEDHIKNNLQEIYLRFKNIIGRIVTDLLGQANLAGHLQIESVTIDFGPVRASDEQNLAQGDFIVVEFGVDWNDGT